MAITSDTDWEVLEEVQNLRKDQTDFHERSLELGRQQVELLRTIVGEGSNAAAAAQSSIEDGARIDLDVDFTDLDDHGLGVSDHA